MSEGLNQCLKLLFNRVKPDGTVDEHAFHEDLKRLREEKKHKAREGKLNQLLTRLANINTMLADPAYMQSKSLQELLPLRRSEIERELIHARPLSNIG
jgi:hypothetical protein